MRRGHGEGSIYQDAAKGRWVAQVRIDGKLVRRFAKTKKEAVEKLGEIKRLESRPDLTVGDLIDNYRKHDLPYRTRARKATLEGLLDKHFKELRGRRASDLRPQDVTEWLSTRRGLSQASLKRLRWLLGRVYRFSMSQRLVDSDPTTDAHVPIGKAPKETKAMTEQELARFLEAAKEESLYPVLLFMARTGVRPGEAFNLKWPQIDLEAETVRIIATKTKANQRPKTRTLRLTPELVEMLSEIDQKSGYVFPGERSADRLNKGQVRKVVQRIGESVGISGLTTYSLRHTFAMSAAKKMPIQQLRDIMGHSTYAALERYYANHDIEALPLPL